MLPLTALGWTGFVEADPVVVGVATAAVALGAATYLARRLRRRR